MDKQHLHLIDCNSTPFIPEGWSLEEHKKGGFFKFDPAKISLYRSRKQKNGRISGRDLRKELADKSTMNANVLDYLLAYPEIIPIKWKDKYVFFWGTIYRDSAGNLCVRYLRWSGFDWRWRYAWLNRVFDATASAALASC